MLPANNKVSSKIDLSNLVFSKRKARGAPTTPSASGQEEPTRSGRTPRTPSGKGKTPRRRRGGENCEDSVATATNTESSAAEISPRKTPRGKTATPRFQKRLLQSTDEEEDLTKKSQKSDSKSLSAQSRRDSRNKDIFSGLSFILTFSKDNRLPMTEPESLEDSSGSESEAQRPVVTEPKYDKRALRSVITAHGGSVLSDVPVAGEEGRDTPTLDTGLMGVSDKECRTMNFLLCLAHSIPLVSHVYILDCVQSGKLLDKVITNWKEDRKTLEYHISSASAIFYLAHLDLYS